MTQCGGNSKDALDEQQRYWNDVYPEEQDFLGKKPATPQGRQLKS